MIQDKNNTVWEATLKIAYSANGEKILYDIDPIKMVEQAGKTATSTTKYSISNSDKNVNSDLSLNFVNGERFSLKIPETDTPNSDIAELLDMLDNEEASEATKLKLAELREKYGVIPKGEKPFRDVA